MMNKIYYSEFSCQKSTHIQMYPSSMYPSSMEDCPGFSITLGFSLISAVDPGFLCLTTHRFYAQAQREHKRKTASSYTCVIGELQSSSIKTSIGEAERKPTIYNQRKIWKLLRNIVHELEKYPAKTQSSGFGKHL